MVDTSRAASYENPRTGRTPSHRRLATDVTPPRAGWRESGEEAGAAVVALKSVVKNDLKKGGESSLFCSIYFACKTKEKEKKLTNIRAAGSDRNILLKPPRNMSLEESLEYIEEDELVEVTPEAIRLRKLLLSEHERRKHARRQSPS